MLCGLIQGPKQPSIDIDVFIEPSMEDMAKLWDDGVKMMDSLTKQKFTLRAITIQSTITLRASRSPDRLKERHAM